MLLAVAIVMVDFPAGVVRWTGMMIFLGATTVLAMGLIGLEAWSLVVVSLPVDRANRAPEQAAESSSSRWVRLSDLLLVVLELRLLATDDRLVVRRVPPNMEAGLPPPRILRGAEEWPLPLLVVLQPDSLSTPSSSGLLRGHNKHTHTKADHTKLDERFVCDEMMGDEHMKNGKK